MLLMGKHPKLLGGNTLESDLYLSPKFVAQSLKAFTQFLSKRECDLD